MNGTYPMPAERTNGHKADKTLSPVPTLQSSYPLTFIERLLCGRQGFQVALVVKIPLAETGDSASIPGLGRSPGAGYGNPLQYSCLEIPWTEEPDGLWPIVSQSWTRLK